MTMLKTDEPAARTKDFVVSADGHILEPTDLFITRLPKHLRERGVWEEDFEVEPLVPGGARHFRRLHTPGYEGWTVSRYRQSDGPIPNGDPDRMLTDMDEDGIDASLFHPNLSLFGLFSDDHELSIAHARVYNDYLIERFLPYAHRIRPTSPIPLTDIDDAVAEIERVAKAGLTALLLPAIPPKPYYLPEYDRVWAAAQASGMNIFFHTATGGVKISDSRSLTMKIVIDQTQQVNIPMTPKIASERMVTQAALSTLVPSRLMSELIGGGVPERFPGLQFGLIEFNAHWLVSLIGGMDKAWVNGIGQDTDWWLGYWDVDRPATFEDQSSMARLFLLNEKWPYPLKPSEYIRRQFHVSFQDDPIAVAARNITGVSTLIWGNDYPHAEGTFRHSQRLIAQQFAGVPDHERKAILGGTLGDILGFTPAGTRT